MNAPTKAPGVRTICPYCGVGCGIVATPDSLGGAAIAGDEAHPANFGRLCSKGSALGETLSLETRLLHPMVDGVRATWDAALERIAKGLRQTVERHGPDAVAFYLSGQLLTEDYYVANKLMKGFIGSSNVDTNSRLCMSSSVAGHCRAFGSDTVPGCYEDLDEADLLVLVGSNAAWCHPVLYQRMVRAREAHGARIITIDVRGTATTENADLALTLRPAWTPCCSAVFSLTWTMGILSTAPLSARTPKALTRRLPERAESRRTLPRSPKNAAPRARTSPLFSISSLRQSVS